MSSLPVFSFTGAPTLVSEPGAASRLGQLAAERFSGLRRVLIVTDPGILRTGLVEMPRHSLEQHGMWVAVFADVLADPPEAVVHTDVEFARNHGTELVIAWVAAARWTSPSSSPCSSTTHKTCSRCSASAR